MKPGLEEKDYECAAERLNVEVAAVKAVAEVESRGDGFLEDDTPKILFERHIFHRLTNGRWSRQHPDISNRARGGYGRAERQHARLQKAVTLDRDAALQSASWGRFQLMGFNWKKLGYATLQDFINAMFRDEAGQLDGFIRYIEAFGLAAYLRNHQWANFAKAYNGKDYAVHNYHGRLAAAYAKHKGE